MQPDPPLDPVAMEKFQRLRALCPMRCQEYEFGGECLRIWTACDIDPLLNRLMEKEDSHPDVKDERMPYWAELWPSSILMADTIHRYSLTLPNAPWLELGCGPGLAGLMAARAGRKGICTDYMSEALWLAEVNAVQNGCGDQIAFRLLDWRSPESDRSFPWILAGDVAYETRNFEPLLDCFDRLLAPGGEIWLGEPGRRIAQDFFRLLTENGWRRSTLNTSKGVSVYRLIRGADKQPLADR